MPIYAATLKGRNKPVLLKADSQAQARDQLVSVETLGSSALADALESGEKIWKPGEALPADSEPEEKKDETE